MRAEEGWSSPTRVALQTVGCKLNQAETESLARSFNQAGYHVIAPSQPADIYVLSTCTVTHVADRKCRNLLRQARRRSPHALIVATGCYAERAPAELGEIDEVGLVVGNKDKGRLAEIVKSKGNSHQGCGQSSKNRGPQLRTRALVNIQEGCNQGCSFCVVPSVRGQERSRLADDIIAEITSRVAEGYKEVILTGTRIGRYEHDGGLRGLTEQILQKTDVPRLRLSSLEPNDVSPDLLRLWRNSRLCPHIHMPLQSGSDPVLERMGRSYSANGYLLAVALAREAIPNLALTTDIMVGFPGESDEEFGDSYRFCERSGFADMHVFPYSVRPGTRAARMANHVDDENKKQRCQLMLDLAGKSGQQFRERFLGREMNVLWEGQKNKLWVGLTDNYLRVFLQDHGLNANVLMPTKIIGLHNGGLRGELMSEGSGS
ncbi:MAG: tRNA (N(6)-L-threonylcarbamoyladenosine(37)-C(2))-methylthiotransferase MtaB [Dehalococcoidia bacterium]